MAIYICTTGDPVVMYEEHIAASFQCTFEECVDLKITPNPAPRGYLLFHVACLVNGRRQGKFVRFRAVELVDGPVHLGVSPPRRQRPGPMLKEDTQ